MDKFEVWKNKVYPLVKSYKEQIEKLVKNINESKGAEAAKKYFENQKNHIKKWLSITETGYKTGKIKDDMLGEIPLDANGKKEVKTVYDQLYKLYQPFAMANAVPRLVALAGKLSKAGLTAEASRLKKLAKDLRS